MNGRFWFGTSFLTQLTLIFSFTYAFLSFEFYGVIIVIQVSVFVGYKHRCKRLETTKFGAVTLLRYIFGHGLHPKKLAHYPRFYSYDYKTGILSLIWFKNISNFMGETLTVFIVNKKNE